MTVASTAIAICSRTSRNATVTVAGRVVFMGRLSSLGDVRVSVPSGPADIAVRRLVAAQTPRELDRDFQKGQVGFGRPATRSRGCGVLAAALCVGLAPGATVAQDDLREVCQQPGRPGRWGPGWVSSRCLLR